MKEYRLVAWPQLRAPYDRIAYRRMLSDMSHRYLTLGQLADSGGVRRQEVKAFLAMLAVKEQVIAREAPVSESLFGSLRPLGGWLRRAWGGVQATR